MARNAVVGSPQHSDRPILWVLAIGSFLVAAPQPAAAQETWRATSTTSVPPGRYGHTAVWTGSRMIVWGGAFYSGGYVVFNTGGLYNPVTDSWTDTSTVNVQATRWLHTAVWTGSRMIVWGGNGYDGARWSDLDTGGIYDPAADSWTHTSMANAPVGRLNHSAVWTGLKMIVWGGQSGSAYLNTGGSYDAATNTWTATATTNAPAARFDHTAVWTGSKMIVWGGGMGLAGSTNTGGVYDPAANTWAATSTTNAPTGRLDHTAVWTGSRLIVWGGQDTGLGYVNTGGIYDPVTDTWAPTSTSGAPAARGGHTAVWTGSRMIVWGGWDGSSASDFNTGGSYDPATDTWIPITMVGAAEAREAATAVWTGMNMLVWGGYNRATNDYLDTGGVYGDPALVPHYSFYSLPPCRVADTRNPAGPSGGPALSANTSRTFPASGTCNIPSTARAVAINVTVVGETDSGDLRLYPAGSTMPLASTVNFTTGKTRANNAVIPLGANGQVSVQCDMAPGSTGRTHFLVDVTGYYQ